MNQLSTTGPSWRAGKPPEDPDKIKRWGFVTAKPSEYLVHVRKGRVLGRSSGQGATCFKWPWDAVAVVPTSLQRVSFKADQITVEKVGVEVVGLAVYRIAEPLLAYRVLNFSYPERAQQKLEETLASMFVGAARRLIANLTVEDCLQKRKHAIAQELLEEIAPVVGGAGRADDTTTQGWGVVIDTIEIQEVRILSESVFRSMQAPYRAELDRQEREARAAAEQQVTMREAMCRREMEEAQMAAQEAIEERRAQLARATVEQRARDDRRASELEWARQRERIESERAIKEASIEAETLVANKNVQAELEREELRARAASRRLELEREALAAEREVGELRLAVQQVRGMLARAEAALQAEIDATVAQGELARGQARAKVESELAQVERVKAEARARQVLAERLPDFAAAVGQRISEVRITQLGAQGNAYESIVQAIAAVVELVRAA